MNTAIKTSWKTMSLLPMTANLLLVACSDEPLMVHGIVKGALVEEDVMEVAVLWRGASGDIAAVEFQPVDSLNGDFQLPLPASPPPEALVPMGETTAASATMVLTVNREFHAHSLQLIVFLSEGINFQELHPDSSLPNLGAGYHVLRPLDDGQVEAVPFDSIIEIDVNSRENCRYRLYPELEQCEERAGIETCRDNPEFAEACFATVNDVCWDAHQERVEACAAGE